MDFSRRFTDFSSALILLTCLLFPASAQAESGYKPSGFYTQENVFIFGPHPYSNPQDVFADYEPIMRYLERKLPGTRFQIETSKNYTEYEEKLAAQRFHFSLPNPSPTPTRPYSAWSMAIA